MGETLWYLSMFVVAAWATAVAAFLYKLPT